MRSLSETDFDAHRSTANAIRVRFATTAAITISTALNPGDTLDGGTLAEGDLILAKDQAATEQNGIYVCAVVPYRLAYYSGRETNLTAAYDRHAGLLVTVEQGTTNADTVWQCTSNRGGTLDTTALAFTRMLAAVGAQPLDATLTALAAYNTNGFLAQTAADTFAGRTFTRGVGTHIANGDGSGIPTISLGNSGGALADPGADGFLMWDDSDTGAETKYGTLGTGLAFSGTTIVPANDLGSLEAMSGTNVIPVRTASDTYTAKNYPTTTVDNTVPRFDSTGGNLQTSGFTIDDNNHISSFGGNIVFPATQSASGNANTLDDYEEGTWTPTFTATAGTLTTITITSANYVTIGSQVTCIVDFTETNIGTASGFILFTLPFTSASPPLIQPGCAYEQAVTGTMFAVSFNSSTTVALTRYDNATSVVVNYRLWVGLVFFR